MITFNARDHFSNRLKKYVLINVIGIAQVLLVSTGLLHAFEGLLPFPKEILETGCHVVALATLAITSFFLHKNYTFK